ncbi:MAG: fibronectin type III domain-containing protein [Ruminococcus sp.]|nr:fibronectin type III domain-containing protein [Ruminococcus sp.]MCM1480270.1 fibronectin type III domain-containing protein [Muribaculaceae bacterium]
MNIKKITALAAAVVMAAGICTGVPAGTKNVSPMAITAEAAESDVYKPTVTLYDDNTADVTWDPIDGAYFYAIIVELYDSSNLLQVSEAQKTICVSTTAKKDFKSGSLTVKAISGRKYTIEEVFSSEFSYCDYAVIYVVGVDKQNTILEMKNGYGVSTQELKVTKKGAAATSSKVAAPTGFKATKTNKSITLSWGEVEGADMYRVYKYNPETKKYEKYKDVKSAKCTITGLSANTKYKFKVAAYDKVDGKYVKGGTSKAASVTTKK